MLYLVFYPRERGKGLMGGWLACLTEFQWVVCLPPSEHPLKGLKCGKVRRSGGP